MNPLPQGSIIGMIGGGQLGRMFCMAARPLGYKTLVWTGGNEAPATEVCDEAIEKPFDDTEALADFVSRIDVATVEFENIPLETLEAVAAKVPLHPSPKAIGIAQNREREKDFLFRNNIPHAPYAVAASADELRDAVEKIGTPSILKTASYGYDGHGQINIASDSDLDAIWQEHYTGRRAVLEQRIPFSLELSVMVARDGDGCSICFDPAENRHRHHILDISIVPARVSPEIAANAQEIAVQVAEALDYQGILGVEFFLLPDGKLLVNEMAPRPHNSGHHTIEACATSQFQQQLRAVCNLPLGSTRLLTPAVMLNLLGDMWPEETTPPDWAELWADGEAHLHLYGKSRAPGRRKMGHATFLGKDLEQICQRADALKNRLLAAAAPIC